MGILPGPLISHLKMADTKKEPIQLIEHEFIPKHELVTEEETQHLLQDYSIKKAQLPKIEKSDPAIRHLEAKRGDVVKILRASLTAGRAIYFRTVI